MVVASVSDGIAGVNRVNRDPMLVPSRDLRNMQDRRPGPYFVNSTPEMTKRSTTKAAIPWAPLRPLGASAARAAMSAQRALTASPVLLLGSARITRAAPAGLRAILPNGEGNFFVLLHGTLAQPASDHRLRLL
jgi:hypothetical protein